MKWPEVPLVERLKSESLLLLLLLAALQWPLARTVKCFTCEGLHCVGEICEGRYCLVSSYASVWGQTHFGQATHVKGCVNGSLLRRSIKSHCEVYSDGDAPEDIKMCICNADYCNANIGDKKREQVEFVTCRCEGSHCGSDKECVGEYCSYVYDSAKKEVHRGCVNRSVPLIERKAQGACMRPPMTGATVHSGALHQSTNVESCLCSEDYCNDRKPKMLRSRKQRQCTTKARLSWNDFPMETKPGRCRGDHCFKVEMTARQSGTHYQAEGCISFINEKTTTEKLSEKGCVEFWTPSLSVKTCFDSQQEEHKTRKEEVVNEEEEEEEQEEEEEEQDEEEEEEKEEDKGKKQVKQTQKPVAQKTTHEVTTEATTEEPEDEEEYENEEEEELKEKHTSAAPSKESEETSHKQKVYASSTEHPSTGAVKQHEEEEHKEVERLKHEEEEEEPEHVNDNTTLVVAFVVIMVIIAVAGLVWKCELHKKIFHSRYQTVAGM